MKRRVVQEVDMKSLRSVVSVVWVLAAGCAAQVETTATPPQGGAVMGGTEVNPGDDAGGDDGAWTPPSVCAVAGTPGSVELRAQLSARAGAAVLATNAAGEVAFSAASSGVGITRLDAQLGFRFAVSFGTVVALDAQGNAFVAGSFSAPTDFGTGVLTPIGNSDVFLVKLSPTGEVVFAMQLGLCGDGIESIALDTSGRIAISGAALGTVVLDATGTTLFQLAAAGKVAFDSHGNLIIGGGFAGALDLGGGHVLRTTGSDDLDAFLAKFDPSGALVFSVQLGDAALATAARAQAIAGVAVGADDTIAFTGAYRIEMDLFGVTLSTPASFPSGALAGSFVGKLDAGGAVVFSRATDALNANVAFGGLVMLSATGVRSLPGTAIAVAANGDVVVSSNTPGDAQPPFAFPQLTVFDGLTGATGLSLGNSTGFLGFGLGVALDGCGNIVWASFANEPSLFDPHTFITILAP